MKVAEWEKRRNGTGEDRKGEIDFPLDLLCIALQCPGTDKSIQKQRIKNGVYHSMKELLSREIRDQLGNSSWIRRMFEAGIELKKKYGAENVYDFSLGNPDLPPPPGVAAALHRIADKAENPFSLGYMPNAGFTSTRRVLAERLSEEQNVAVSGERVIVTCGAAGGLNAFFRAVLNPGDEVICPSPYFVEYGFYAGNCGGILKPVRTKEDFSLDCAAIAEALSPATRAVLVNSPNNPTGRIYSRAELEELARVLKMASEKYGRTVYLIADEPYRFLNFDSLEIPSVFELYPASVVIGSFSKSLSLAGERIGYVAVNPALEGGEALVAGVIMTNRILGFVNAPVIGQMLIEECARSLVDLEVYRRRRDLMAAVLDAAGIEYAMPRGAFYFFPKSPTEDESAFIQALVAERILAVPGTGFGLPGYFRLAFCVEDSVIRNSADSFKRAVAAVKDHAASPDRS